MSKRSRRRNKVLAAMVGLAGASKLGLLPSGSTVGMGKSDVYAKAAKARKAKMATNIIGGGGSKGAGIGSKIAGITNIARSDLPEKRNLKSIFRQDDGSIIKGLEKFKDKETFSKAMKKRRGEPSFKEFLNKVILGPKTQLNKGKMIKARGGGMTRVKPTKMY